MSPCLFPTFSAHPLFICFFVVGPQDFPPRELENRSELSNWRSPPSTHRPFFLARLFCAEGFPPASLHGIGPLTFSAQSVTSCPVPSSAMIFFFLLSRSCCDRLFPNHSVRMPGQRPDGEGSFGFAAFIPGTPPPLRQFSRHPYIAMSQTPRGAIELLNLFAKVGLPLAPLVRAISPLRSI